MLEEELEYMKLELEDKKLKQIESKVFEECMKDPSVKHLAITTETLMIDSRESVNEKSDENEEYCGTNMKVSDNDWLKTVSAAEVPSPKTTLNLGAASYNSPDNETLKASPAVSEFTIESESEAVAKVPEEFELKTKEVAILHSARDLEKKNVFVFSAN